MTLRRKSGSLWRKLPHFPLPIRATNYWDGAVSRNLSILLLGCLLVSARPARAGLYNPSELPAGPDASRAQVLPLPFPLFRDRVTDLYLGVLRPEHPLHKRYVQQVEQLQTRVRANSASVDDQISLSAYLIRLGQMNEALELLTRLEGRQRGNFLVYANLAVANQRAGHLKRAVDYLTLVKDYWPTERPGWSQTQLDWYKRAEAFHSRLLRLRYAESRDQIAGPPRAPANVDDLFGVRFVGDGGQYEAGKLAAEQRAKLPPDAVAVVQQLLIWLPDDTRLYWLLGELLNAQGDIEAASKVFDECRGMPRHLDAPELQKHRQIVQEAVARLAPADTGSDLAAPAGPEPPGDWLPDKKHIVVVSGIAGLVVALLAFLQVREVRRRRQGKTTTPRGS